MKVAVEGCCHGELDAIYAHIANLERKNGYKVSLLLMCGDFQAIRNHQDLQCMAVPPKYRQLGGFYKYYTGEKIAPMLTIVIGGNHEASNYLWELYHGGWLAPNIYFLGHAGCVQVSGIRIAGASGIFKGHDFSRGHYERMPYDNSDMRTIYHIREYNIRRLSLLSSPDIFLSHDWPQSIEQHGDVQGLIRRKPFFRQDIQTGKLGSPPLMGLLRSLQPQWWFAAHLHVRFEAEVVHDGSAHAELQGARTHTQVMQTVNPDEIKIDDEDFDTGAVPETSAQSDPAAGMVSRPMMRANPDEITIDDEEFDVVAAPPAPVSAPAPVLPQARSTKFLALDKCSPRGEFLEVIEIPTSSDVLPGENAPFKDGIGANAGAMDSAEIFVPALTFDPEWLAITRAFHPYMSFSRQQAVYPDEAAARAKVNEELAWVRKHVLMDDADSQEGNKAENSGENENKDDGEKDARPSERASDREALHLKRVSVSGCQQFVQTAPGPGVEGPAKFQQPPWYTNPQTVAFCEMLGLENKINPPPHRVDASGPDA